MRLILWVVEYCKNWTSLNILLYSAVYVANLCYFCGVLILTAVIKLYLNACTNGSCLDQGHGQNMTDYFSTSK